MKRVRFSIQEEEYRKFDTSSSEEESDESDEDAQHEEEADNRAGVVEDEAVQLMRRRLQDGELDVRGRILYRKL